MARRIAGKIPRTLRPVAVAVAGYGKLGGLELGYASDLDLVFLHDSAGSIQLTDGEKPLDNGIFFLRLGTAHRAFADDAFRRRPPL